MNLQELQQLREIFRARFREVDFCIGEKQVEILFRELLGETEPVPRPCSSNFVQNNEIILELLGEINNNALFERDDKFYQIMKKN